MIVIPCWLYVTDCKWGVPHVPTKPAQVVHDVVNEPLPETLWFAGSAVALLMFSCSAFRSLILTCIVSLGSLIMSAFVGVAAAAAGFCFDMSAAGVAGLGAALAGGGLVAADAAAAAEGAAMAEAGMAAD